MIAAFLERKCKKNPKDTFHKAQGIDKGIQSQNLLNTYSGLQKNWPLQHQ